MAPEVLFHRKYDTKADVWSLGCVFYEMLTGFTPFTGVSKKNLAENVQAGEYFIPKTVKLSLQGLDFLNSCLKYDSAERLSMLELLHHPYISCDEHLDSGGDISEQLYLSYMPGASLDKGSPSQHQKVQQNPTAWVKNNKKDAVFLNAHTNDKFEQIYNDRLMKAFGSEDAAKPQSQPQKQEPELLNPYQQVDWSRIVQQQAPISLDKRTDPKDDMNLLDDIQPIEVEMLVPSQHFMNTYEFLNQPKIKGFSDGHKTAPRSKEEASTYFDCNPSSKDVLDESLAFEAKHPMKVETFDANAQSPIEEQLLQQLQKETVSQQSQLVDLLEESVYPLVTKNEQFIVKFEGTLSEPSAALVKSAAKLQKEAFKINQAYF